MGLRRKSKRARDVAAGFNENFEQTSEINNNFSELDKEVDNLVSELQDVPEDIEELKQQVKTLQRTLNETTSKLVNMSVGEGMRIANTQQGIHVSLDATNPPPSRPFQGVTKDSTTITVGWDRAKTWYHQTDAIYVTDGSTVSPILKAAAEDITITVTGYVYYVIDSAAGTATLTHTAALPTTGDYITVGSVVYDSGIMQWQQMLFENPYVTVGGTSYSGQFAVSPKTGKTLTISAGKFTAGVLTEYVTATDHVITSSNAVTYLYLTIYFDTDDEDYLWVFEDSTTYPAQGAYSGFNAIRFLIATVAANVATIVEGGIAQQQHGAIHVSGRIV